MHVCNDSAYHRNHESFSILQLELREKQKEDGTLESKPSVRDQYIEDFTPPEEERYNLNYYYQALCPYCDNVVSSHDPHHNNKIRHVIHTTFIVLYAFLMRQATPKLK